MLRRIIGALLVCRLELRQLPLDPELVLALWRQRPVIEIVMQYRSDDATQHSQWTQRLDEVYPF